MSSSGPTLGRVGLGKGNLTPSVRAIALGPQLRHFPSMLRKLFLLLLEQGHEHLLLLLLDPMLLQQKLQDGARHTFRRPRATRIALSRSVLILTSPSAGHRQSRVVTHAGCLPATYALGKVIVLLPPVVKTLHPSGSHAIFREYPQRRTLGATNVSLDQ